MRIAACLLCIWWLAQRDTCSASKVLRSRDTPKVSHAAVSKSGKALGEASRTSMLQVMGISLDSWGYKDHEASSSAALIELAEKHENFGSLSQTKTPWYRHFATQCRQDIHHLAYRLQHIAAFSDPLKQRRRVAIVGFVVSFSALAFLLGWMYLRELAKEKERPKEKDQEACTDKRSSWPIAQVFRAAPAWCFKKRKLLPPASAPEESAINVPSAVDSLEHNDAVTDAWHDVTHDNVVPDSPDSVTKHPMSLHKCELYDIYTDCESEATHCGTDFERSISMLEATDCETESLFSACETECSEYVNSLCRACAELAPSMCRTCADSAGMMAEYDAAALSRATLAASSKDLPPVSNSPVPAEQTIAETDRSEMPETAAKGTAHSPTLLEELQAVLLHRNSARSQATDAASSSSTDVPPSLQDTSADYGPVRKNRTLKGAVSDWIRW